MDGVLSPTKILIALFHCSSFPKTEVQFQANVSYNLNSREKCCYLLSNFNFGCCVWFIRCVQFPSFGLDHLRKWCTVVDVGTDYTLPNARC